MTLVTEYKSVAATFKALKTPGEFEAEFSVFGNIDLDGDRMIEGAFKDAQAANPNPPIIWTHRWDIPPIGETLEWGETGGGVKGVGRLFLGDHEVADQVWPGLKSHALKEYSYAMNFGSSGCRLVACKEGESSPRSDGRVREIFGLKELIEWGPTLKGANPQTATIDIAKAGARLVRAIPKAYGDIDSWEITCLTNMIDYGTSFIVSEDDPEDVASMKAILGDVLGLLTKEMGEEPDVNVTAYLSAFETMLRNGARKSGARNSAEDQARIQTIHDLAMNIGAACASPGSDLQDVYGGKSEEEQDAIKARLAGLRMMDYAR